MMNFDEIVVKESPGLCRCCLSEGCYKDLSVEYTWMGDTEIYADMLLECFDISISQHNEGPNGGNRLICEVCITRLRDACNFKKQVADAEKKFIDMLARGELQPKVIMYQATPMKTEDVMEEDADAEVEYLDDDMFEDDLPLKRPADSGEPSASDVTVETLKVKGKRGRPKKTAPVKTEKRSKVSKIEEQPRTSKAIVKDIEPQADGFASERRRKNLQILFNSTTIMPFKWRGKYICFYCGKTTAEHPELKTHTKSHGKCTTKDYSLKVIKGSHVEIKIDVSEIACDVCSEPFGCLNEIIDHLIGKHNLEYDKNVNMTLQEYNLANCKCLYCEQAFNYFGNLVSHVNINHPQNCFICNDCGGTFNKKRDLAVHIRNYHKQGGYTCEECLKIFPNRRVLVTHKKHSHYQRCKICNTTFASFSLFQKHTKIYHPDDGNFQCSYCNKQLHSKQGLKQHLNKCKDKPVEDTVIEDCQPTEEPKKRQDVHQIRENIISVLNMSTAIPFRFLAKYSCFYCSKKFVDFDELKDHVVLEHPVCDMKSKCIKKCKGERAIVKIDTTNLSCKICGMSMNDLDTLIDHLISTHNVKYDKSFKCFETFRIIKDNVPCEICGETFRYFGILLRHINSVHSNNNCICDFCGRSFKNRNNLTVHISYAHTSIECEICLIKFKNQWCLSRHKAKTHDAKYFKCPKCPETFQSQYHKQKHLIKDHNIGHKCGFCGRMFTRNSFMKDHIRRTHLKEKNVPCSVCNEKFFDNTLLKLHMVKHEGDRKFSCAVCGKAFLRRSNLCSHMEMHKKYGHVQLPVA